MNIIAAYTKKILPIKLGGAGPHNT